LISPGCIDPHRATGSSAWRPCAGSGAPANRFRVDVVVLVRFDEGPNVLGRHELHFVPLCHENTCQEVGTGTSLHADQTGGHVYCMGDKLLPREAPLDDDLAFFAQAD
jgi:hypothetical protein